jgi:short-subunit dehydrogenase
MQDHAAATFDEFLEELGGADLVIISAGTGHENLDLKVELDTETVMVNVVGFMNIAQAAMRHFLKRGRGHLVGITSVAALRGNATAAAYAASKAFQSVYLDGLRDLGRRSGFPIAVTEAQPGAVDTAMFKTEAVPIAVRWLVVSSPSTAARQIVRAIRRRTKHAYVTKRYALLAWIFKLLPRAG